MNYFNHQNIQLAYGAVYDQDLCESMEDLGLIGEYDDLDEDYKRMTKRKIDRMEKQMDKKSNKMYKIGQGERYQYPNEPKPEDYQNLERQIDTIAHVRDDFTGMNKGERRLGIKPKYGPAISKAKAKANRERGQNKVQQSEAYELILDYLIQEGYADTLGSAEIILENMSDEWIEAVLDEGRIEDLKWKYNQRYGKPEGGDTMRLHVARNKYGSAASAHSDRPSFNRSPNTAPTGKQTPGQAMYKAGRSAQEMRGKVIRPRNPNRNR
jgi:hypothetical protein